MTEQTIVHEVALAGYKATSTGGMLDLGTWGSYGIEKLHLTLDAAWQDLTITAFFNVKGEVVAKKVVGKDGYADVPWEATKENTLAGRIVFEGSINGRRRISANLNYKVTNHSEITDSDPVPTDDRWNQFVTENKEYRDGAFEAAERANARAEDAEAASDDAQAAARAVKASETAANASKNAAATSEDNARISAGAAAASADKAKASETAAAESAGKAAASEKTTAVSAVAAAGSAAQAETQKTAAAKSASAAQGYMQTAISAATDANASAENAAGSKAAAASSATAAAGSATAAAGDAKTSSDAAAVATDAKAAAVDAQKDATASAAAAKTSEGAAAKSAADADRTANSINESMTQIAANKAAVSQLKEDTTALQKRQNVLVGSETGNPVSCDDAFAAPLCGLNVYGKSTQDGTPSPDNPVPIVSAGDGGSVAVRVTGKNLLNPALFQNNKYQGFNAETGYYGIDSVNGYWITGIQPCLPSTTYHFNAMVEGGCFYDEKKNVIGIADFASTIKTPAKCAYYCVNFSSAHMPYGKPIIATVSESTAYSPYREQLLTLPTPNGLPGIPVTSGGNYTDQNGQQWVCDEVDLERGVKVQRVNRLKLDDLSWRYELTQTNKSDTFISTISASQSGTERGYSLCQYAVFDGVAYDIEMAESCRCYVWSSSATIQFKAGSDINSVDAFSEWLKARPDASISYCLATPIETPLTPAEIAAYKAITAYAPDTVVQASDGAGVKLEYQKDVNIAIKKLEDAIASMTAT